MRSTLRCVGLLLALILLVLPVGARAGSHARYALVVGNNHGHSERIELDDLFHAEREARRLHNKLVQHGNFDPGRTELVVGGTRAEVLAAVKRLAEVHRRDRQDLGELPTLFAFFFTGHGLSGELLTADQPLTGDDLASLFKELDATLNVGFFDACHAGSLTLGALSAKGIKATPGFNPVEALPEELLNSEGTLWFVSSRPEELSYEDERLGGLFTHFFIESFSRGQGDGIGVTLEDMWEYTRRRTLAHAARYGRSQSPEKIVSKLTARGPLYFSFAGARSAKLVFDPVVAGTFLLQYEYGALVEKVVKTAGKPLEVSVFQGRLVLTRMDDGQSQARPTQQLHLPAGASVRIRPQGGPVSARGPGYREAPIRSKGHLPGLELVEAEAAPDLMLGVGYRFGLVPDGLLGANHQLSIGAKLAYGSASVDLIMAYGRRAESHSSWSLKEDELGLGLRAGYGFSLAGTRLDLQLGGDIRVSFVEYGSGTSRRPFGAWAGGGLSYLVPLPLERPWVVLQARIDLGMRWAEGVALNDRKLYSAFEPVFGLGLSFPLNGR